MLCGSSAFCRRYQMALSQPFEACQRAGGYGIYPPAVLMLLSRLMVRALMATPAVLFEYRPEQCDGAG